MHGVGWAQALCRSESLPSRARLVGLALAVHCTAGDSPSCRASLSTIAAWARIKRDTAIFALADLAAEGWIAPQRVSRPSAKGGRRHATSTYILTMPACGQLGDNPVDKAVENLGTEDVVVPSADQGGPVRGPLSGPVRGPQERKRISKGAESRTDDEANPARQAAVLRLVRGMADAKRI